MKRADPPPLLTAMAADEAYKASFPITGYDCGNDQPNQWLFLAMTAAVYSRRDAAL